MKTVKTTVCVVGAGAGGTGCVYRLVKNGIKTVVVDKYPNFGGTAVFCGVDGWEPGVSLDGIHTLLKDELEKMENGCNVIDGIPNCNLLYPENGLNFENHSFEKYPWSLAVPTDKPYEKTLWCGKSPDGEEGARFQFEPDAMIKAINNVLCPYKGNLTTYFGYSFKDCTTEKGRVTSVIISNSEETVKIEADYFVDCTGDIVFARKAGCAYSFGSEGKEEYNEPSANVKSNSVNGVSYIFRFKRTEDEDHIDDIPQEVKDYKNPNVEKWINEVMRRKISCFFMYPRGDYNANMLPTMDGKEYYEFGDEADAIGRARVYAYWNYLQRERGLKGFTLTHIYDAGVRESHRLKGKYVLTENDVRGITKKPEKRRVIAIADHTLDIHGDGKLGKAIDASYEVPLECCMTNEFDNLFVASKGASFTHIAASSVRLTRTILSIGEGVGEYISELINPSCCNLPKA